MEGLGSYADVRVATGPAWPGVSYFCSTRQGGVSQGEWASLNVGLHTGDDSDHVTENRRRITPPGSRVIWLNQVHGTAVYDTDQADAGDASDADMDAAVTSRYDCVLAIMTADCLPVVLGSSDGQVIGAAHAGWRGLAGGVLENTLAALQAKHQGPGVPSWRAWIGPGISQACFEVGDEVRRCFVDADPAAAPFFAPGRQGKWQADLPAIARHRLVRKGVARVDVSTLCTYSRPDLFYSYRRDGMTGRMVTFAWRVTGT